jgi:diguanylate cyclase (GGDEF)-like protein
LEIALPHVVVRICGPGVGPDLVAALGLYPLEVSEARDASEARRVAHGCGAVLVVVTDPPDARAAIAETWSEFPRTPIVLVAPVAKAADAREPGLSPPDAEAEKGWVDAISGGLPLADICWHVLEAVSRAALLGGVADHPLGPALLEVDDAGCVKAVARAAGIPAAGRPIEAGDSLLPLIAPADREPFALALGRLQAGETRFTPLRLVDARGGSRAASAATRRVGADRCAVLLQPLIAGGPIVGRHINNRDPITGLLTRWAMTRALDSHADAEAAGPVLLVLKLDNFPAISEYIGHEATDVVLVRVASVMSSVLPYPAVCSRVMGDTFLACLPGCGIDEGVQAAERLIRGVNDIDMPGFSARFHLRAAVGIATSSRRNHDLALRLADAAANEARAAGGDRPIVAQIPATGAVARELAAAMEVGTWEVWLQPVAGEPGGPPVFHEAVARFGNGRGRVITRPDFFAAGRAQGLLERFDRMMLHRVIELLAAHPDARISVNVSLETFVSEAFPASYLDPIRALPNGGTRIILEIPPHALALPTAGAASRLEPLAAAGVAIAADDFGSGLCRLQDLTQCPLAIVKLDELVTGYVDDDPLQREFVRTVVSVCRARGIMTVAEYTRSPEQLRRLVADGVDWFQGELLGMPAPAASILELASPSVGMAPEPTAFA